jgi:dTMP kinase
MRDSTRHTNACSASPHFYNDGEKCGATDHSKLSQNRNTPPNAPQTRGVFITFEGGEGVGKSTQILLLARRLEAAGVEVLRLREPGGTRISEEIRAILLDPANGELDNMSELLLYEAARAQLVGQVIEPALARGVTVLCDRFTDSTLAYQGTARGLDLGLVEHANQLGSKGLVPQRTIVLLHDLHDALSRATQEGADRVEAEGLAFHRRVREGFLSLAHQQAPRVRLVQSCERKQDTAEAIFAEVADLFPQVAQQDFVITDELLTRVKQERD